MRIRAPGARRAAEDAGYEYESVPTTDPMLIEPILPCTTVGLTADDVAGRRGVAGVGEQRLLDTGVRAHTAGSVSEMVPSVLRPQVGPCIRVWAGQQAVGVSERPAPRVAEPGAVVADLAELWVPRILSRHATCTYSWMRPPSRSRRSGRIAASERGGAPPAGGC
jgi:hypothetical protein